MLTLRYVHVYPQLHATEQPVMFTFIFQEYWKLIFHVLVCEVKQKNSIKGEENDESKLN